MDTTQIICTVINGIFAIIVCIVGARIAKTNKESKVSEDRRKKSQILTLEMMDATLKLSVVCANALTGGKNNGNVEVAKKKALDVETKYVNFEHEVLSEELTEW